MKKRILALLLLSVLGLVSIMGCGNTQKPSESQKQEETGKAAGSEESVEKPDYDWSDKEFMRNVPMPDTDKTSVESNDDDHFYVYVNGGEKDYKKYVEQCKEAGFTFDVNEWEEGFSAFHENGEKIDVSLDGTQYSIIVYRSLINSSFEWPTNGLATLITTPKSNVGEITTDSTDYFSVYVAQTSKEDFKEFIKGCEEKGFKYNYTKNNDYFQARNHNGDQITLQYGGVNTMHISMRSSDGMDDDWVAPEE